MSDQLVDIGDVVRVAMAFLDEDDAVQTPTAGTITRQYDGTTTAVAFDDASVTLGKVFPLRIRTELARHLYGIDAADLASGTGCVEYVYTPTLAGRYRFIGKALSPTVSSAQAAVAVQANFV